MAAFSLETGERFKFARFTNAAFARVEIDTNHGGGGPIDGGAGGAAGASPGADVAVLVDVEDSPQPTAETATAKANTIEDDMRLIK